MTKEEMKDGVYFLLRSNQIIYLFSVRNYKDMTTRFSIVSWENENEIIHKVLITSDQYHRFIRMGPL